MSIGGRGNKSKSLAAVSKPSRQQFSIKIIVRIIKYPLCTEDDFSMTLKTCLMLTPYIETDCVMSSHVHSSRVGIYFSRTWIDISHDASVVIYYTANFLSLMSFDVPLIFFHSFVFRNDSRFKTQIIFIQFLYRWHRMASKKRYIFRK